MIDPMAPLYVQSHDLALDVLRRCGPEGSAALRAGLVAQSLELLHGVAHALSFPADREADLVRADRALASLRVDLRLAEALGVFDERAQVQLGGRCVEIGKMLGGWQRSAQRRARRGRASPPTGA